MVHSRAKAAPFKIAIVKTKMTSILRRHVLVAAAATA
jgi:hypothetical protein